MPLDYHDLLAVVGDPRSLTDLKRYFEPERPPSALPTFTGSRFEELADGGDRSGAADAITTDDLVAVQMLSVRVPREVALDLLEGPLGHDVAEQLNQVSTTVDLGSDEAATLLADDGPAARAWQLLEAPDDMGWVIAGKLLARKRPRLVPVYDGVVKCGLGAPSGAWLWLQRQFAENDGELPRRLRDLQTEAGLPRTVHPPRVLDVIFWMRHHSSHRRSRCPRNEFGTLRAPR